MSYTHTVLVINKDKTSTKCLFIYSKEQVMNYYILQICLHMLLGTFSRLLFTLVNLEYSIDGFV